MKTIHLMYQAFLAGYKLGLKNEDEQLFQQWLKETLPATLEQGDYIITLLRMAFLAGIKHGSV